MELAHGAKIANRFKILACLGGQGATRLFQAKDTMFDRVVALKLLSNISPDNITQSAALRSSFVITAQSNLCGINKAFELVEQDNSVALVSEYLENGSLTDLIEAGGKLSIREFLKISHQISGAVANIHASGLIHANLKPNNVLFDHEYNVKLSDLELSDSGSYTIYSAPELSRGRPASIASDIYSIGVILFVLCEMLGAAKNESEANFFERLFAIISQASCINPEQRYNSVPELIFDLHQAELELNTRVLMSSKAVLLASTLACVATLTLLTVLIPWSF